MGAPPQSLPEGDAAGEDMIEQGEQQHEEGPGALQCILQSTIAQPVQQLVQDMQEPAMNIQQVTQQLQPSFSSVY